MILTFFKRLGNTLVRRYLRNIDSNPSKEFHPYFDDVSIGRYYEMYNKFSAVTDTPPSVWRRDRFLNLFEIVCFALDRTEKTGKVAECGCWKGLSSRLICEQILFKRPKFDGSDFYVFDSFEGLSKPSRFDKKVDNSFIGMFSSGENNLRKVLSDFPNVNILKGWIPDVFSKVSKQKYSFVHLDVDLAEPTIKSLEFFWPQMLSGGIILCDDYGSKMWLGTKIQTDNFVVDNKISYLRLSTGQILLFK